MKPIIPSPEIVRGRKPVIPAPFSHQPRTKKPTVVIIGPAAAEIVRI